MKSFIITLTLFVLLLSCILLNAIYINEEIGSLTEGAESLGGFDSPDFTERMDKLEESWRKFRKLADVSCARSDLNKIDETLQLLRVYASTKSYVDFEATRVTLVFLFEDLCRLEKITLKGLI